MINDASKEGNTINVFGRNLFCSLSASASIASLKWHFCFLLGDGLSFIIQNRIILVISRVRGTSHASSGGVFSYGMLLQFSGIMG